MKTKSIKEKVKEYFLQNPTSKLRVRQIEKLLKVPIPSVIRYAKELEQEGILQRLEIAGVHFYHADRASAQFILEKKHLNLRSLYHSGLVDFLRKEYGNPTIIIFGSYAKGEDIETSDIDIFTETSRKEIKRLEPFEKRLGKKIQLFTARKLAEIPNKNLANNIINGIIINGFIEVFT